MKNVDTTVLPFKAVKKGPITNSTLNSSHNNIQNNASNAQKSGFFSNMWNKFKSWWIIEEEEYIDAHGFKAKRPKHKIPLRNKEAALKSEANFKGGESLAYASQHSPFGRMFL